MKECFEEGLFSDPNDCSGFTSCVSGKYIRNTLIGQKIFAFFTLRCLRLKFAGELYQGSCGFGRFFDAVTGLCVKASPQICIPGQSLRISQPDLDYERFREVEEVESLDLKQEGSRIVCYVTSWALYRKGEGKFVPEHLDPRLCTDVVYAFAGLNPDSFLIQPFDPWADIENSEFKIHERYDGTGINFVLQFFHRSVSENNFD